MGCVPSRPALHPQQLVLQLGSQAQDVGEADASRSSELWGGVSGRTSAGDLLTKAKLLLQEVMVGGSASEQGLDAAARAASVLLWHLGVASVSIAACTSSPGVFINAARQSRPVRWQRATTQQLLLAGDDCAAGCFSCTPEPRPVLYATAASADEAAALPEDWAEEWRNAGARAFLAVPITARQQGSLLGVLTVTSCQLDAFWDPWWEPLLGIVAAGLVPLLQDPLMRHLCDLAMHLLHSHECTDFVTTLLQHASALLEAATNGQLGLRVGLLSPDGDSMLLMLPASSSLERQRSAEPSAGASDMARKAARAHVAADATIDDAALKADGGSLPLPPPPSGKGVRVLQQAAAHSLLAKALASQQAHVVCDTSAYLQDLSEPGHDVFVAESKDVVASMAVAPVLLPAAPPGGGGGGQRSGALRWGAVYVTRDTPGGFANELPAINALARTLSAVLAQHRAGHAPLAWKELLAFKAAATAAPRRNSCSSTASKPSVPASPRSLRSSGSDAAAEAGAALAGGAYGCDSERQSSFSSISSSSGSSSDSTGCAPAAAKGGGQAPASPAGGSQPIATCSMVELLRAQVERSKQRNAPKPDASYVSELKLTRLIGKGGFGHVYAGQWHGSPVAIKVMYVQHHERQLMKSAMEMAVLSSVRHPNIIRVYACLTDMMEEAASPLAAPGSVEPCRLRYRPAPRGPSADSAFLCNLVVMEYADRGNLHQAMRQGLLHKRTANRGLVVDMRLLNTVLLQVAHSVQHLHQQSIIHCDVKSENILLASSSTSPTGFVCKLGDFGLVKLLLGRYYLTNRSGSGTVTHLAPELFASGSKITTKVDSYAFGVMMFELYCCRRPYSGMRPDTIASRVCRQHDRPQFPAGTLPAYQALAERCWAPKPRDRPAFGEIVAELSRMLDAVGGPFTLAQPHPHSRHAAQAAQAPRPPPPPQAPPAPPPPQPAAQA